MNFFGHAAVALWRSNDSAFVFGAMLPDFWSMIRARPPAMRDAELAAGVRYHHATDEVFHETAAFRRLGSEAFEALSSSGVRRSSARAVAHIGIEILLDGVLVENVEARNAYLAALAAGTDRSNALSWSNEREQKSFRGLLDALSARGVSVEHAHPDIVTLRITRALSSRPRLALDPQAETLVRGWSERTFPEVVRSAPELFDELRRGLSAAILDATPTRS